MQGEGWELPEGVNPWSSFHWFKVSARKPLRLIVLSERPHWYIGHYVDGRMWPCQAPGCSVCEDGTGKQVRYVMAVVDRESKRVGLIEVSESLGELIRSWVPRNEGLRGMHLTFAKHSASVRSRTEVEFEEMGALPWWRDLEVPDPKVALELTWRKMKVPAASSQDRRARDYREGRAR